MKVSIIYPCDFFDKHKVDKEYEAEFIESCKFDFHIFLLDYEELVSNNHLNIYPNVIKESLCIYRGWMLKPEQYNMLYRSLRQKGLELINTPEQYLFCHEFPNSYPILNKVTPPILTFPKGAVIDWETAKKEFKKFMIKDFVKSVKGNQFPQFFDDTYTNMELEKYLEKFIELRGDLYTGGIVLKKYMPLAKFHGNTNEYRAFYFNGYLISLLKNSGQKGIANDISMTFVGSIPNLRSNFYTVDFAELENGDWIVIEVGDGQVSGLSQNQNILEFYREIEGILQNL